MNERERRPLTPLVGFGLVAHRPQRRRGGCRLECGLVVTMRTMSQARLLSAG